MYRHLTWNFPVRGCGSTTSTLTSWRAASRIVVAKAVASASVIKDFLCLLQEISLQGHITLSLWEREGSLSAESRGRHEMGTFRIRGDTILVERRGASFEENR